MVIKRIFLVFLSQILLLFIISCQLPQTLSSVDSDGDGWSDAQEKIAGTDPRKVDTDGDGYWDPHDTNPLDTDIPVVGGAQKHQSSPTPTPTPTKEISPSLAAEAAAIEYQNVQDAVSAMMKSNNLTELANPITVPTNDMRRFPDAIARHGAAGVGYALYCHDFNGDGIADINYIPLSKTKGTYICDRYGKVTQVTTGY